MVQTASCILLAVAAASAVQVGYVSQPVPTILYTRHPPPPVYGHPLTPYRLQGALAPRPFQIIKPIEENVNYHPAPLPLPYVANEGTTIDDEDDEEAYDDEDLDHRHKHSYEKGEGSDHGEEHHSTHGEKGAKGYKAKNHYAKGETGHYKKEHHDGYYKNSEGRKKGHQDVAEAHGKHHAAGKGYSGKDHGHKKYSSKGEDVTGYHKVFHKDELKKDHDFYDVADKSGHFNKHGYEKGSHGSEEGAHKQGGHHNSAGKKEKYGKREFHNKENSDDGHYSYSGEEGLENHDVNDAEYGKNGGSEYKKEYDFSNDDGDDYDGDDE